MTTSKKRRRIAPSQARRHKEVAQAIDTVADEYLRIEEVWRKRKCRTTEQIAKNVSCTDHDVAALRTVGKLVRTHRLENARDFAAELDSLVRDELPLNFFGLLTVSGIRW